MKLRSELFFNEVFRPAVRPCNCKLKDKLQQILFPRDLRRKIIKLSPIFITATSIQQETTKQQENKIRKMNFNQSIYDIHPKYNPHSNLKNFVISHGNYTVNCNGRPIEVGTGRFISYQTAALRGWRPGGNFLPGQIYYGPTQPYMSSDS